MNAVLTEELPVLPEMTHPYRGYVMDNYRNPSNYGTYAAIGSGRSPEQLVNEGNHYSAAYVSMWNEAHNENARRNATVDPVALTLGELDDLRAQVATLTAENDRLKLSQISGDDPRLTDFWDKANELASNAGHCSVYDELAEELGGPGRVKSYDFTVDVTVTVTVTGSGRDEDAAWENVDREMIHEAFENTSTDAYSISYNGYDDYEVVDD